jgi:hypothetical protein
VEGSAPSTSAWEKKKIPMASVAFDIAIYSYNYSSEKGICIYFHIYKNIKGVCSLIGLFFS